ncbi:MAG: LytR/AlgR family response regulator transcription factor [Eubacterium callanderi]
MFIILCEDNAEDRENAARLIEEVANGIFPDHCFQVFEDAESCLKAIRKQPPDIAFIDIFLKEKNGIELAEAVRKLNPEVAIIFLTMSNEFASESYRVRAVDYILKPAEQRLVVEALRQCIRQQDMVIALTIRQRQETLRIDQQKIEK